MKTIPVSRGQVALVDDEDFERLSQWTWTASGKYACRQVCSGRSKTSRGKVVNIMMHRLINQTPDGFDTDHIDGNGLNNQRANLRTATRTQNNMNTGLRVDNTSGYKGVAWFKPAKTWRIYLGGSKNRVELGYRKDFEDAVMLRMSAEEQISL